MSEHTEVNPFATLYRAVCDLEVEVRRHQTSLVYAGLDAGSGLKHWLMTVESSMVAMRAVDKPAIYYAIAADLQARLVDVRNAKPAHMDALDQSIDKLGESMAQFIGALGAKLYRTSVGSVVWYAGKLGVVTDNRPGTARVVSIEGTVYDAQPTDHVLAGF